MAYFILMVIPPYKRVSRSVHREKNLLKNYFSNSDPTLRSTKYIHFLRIRISGGVPSWKPAGKAARRKALRTSSNS